MNVRNKMNAGLAVALVVTLAACGPKGEALYARAQDSLDKGDVNAAVIDLKNLLQAEPQNGKARALLGDAYIQQGNAPASEIELQKAKDLGVPAEMLLVPGCKVMLAKAQFDKVLAQCKPDAAPAASQAELHIVTGNALLALNRAAEAKPHFEAAIAAKPGSLDAVLGLAATAYATGGLSAARDVLDKAPAPLKEKARYWLTVGSVAMRGGDFAGAEKAMQTAVDKYEKEPDSNEKLAAIGGLAEAQMRQGKVKEASATSDRLAKMAPNNLLVKQLRGQIALAGNKLEEARTLLEEVVAAQPDNFQARLLLGIVNMQQGNLGQAEMHFSNVVTNHPENAAAQRLLAEVRATAQTPQESLASIKPTVSDKSAEPLMLAMAARLAMASGNRDEALGYLDRAAADPAIKKDPNAQLEVANGYLGAGDLDKALAVLQSIPAGGMSDLQREYALMLTLLRKGEKDKAVAEGNALVQRSGNDPKARNLVASIFLAAGQNDAARKQLQEALKLRPDDQDTLLNLARLDLIEGKAADAATSLQKILDKDPKNPLAMAGMATAAMARNDQKEAERWLIALRDADPKSLRGYLGLVRFYVGIRDFGKAKATLDDADKAMPNNADVASMRGSVAFITGDLPTAIAAFERAVKLDPGTPGHALNLARAHFLNKDNKSAFAVLDGVLKSNPSDSSALSLAAAIAMQTGDGEKAAGYMERLRRVAPDAAQTQQLEGDLAMTQKRYKEAAIAYQKSGAKAPNRAVTIGEYNARRLANDPQPERPLLDWLAKYPADPIVRTQLAQYYQARGRLDAAAKTYEDALQLTPDNAVLLNNLAVVYQDQGNSKALATAEKAYKLAPQSPAIQDTYGWLLVQKGDAAKGLELINSALKQAPDSAELQYHQAAAMAKTGDKAGALPVLKKALAGQMPPAAKADAQKLLAELSK